MNSLASEQYPAHGLVKRLDAFLAKIHERLGEIIAEAEPGLQALTEHCATDVAAFANAELALDARMEQLLETMGKAWGEQIEPQFEALEAQAPGILAFGELRVSRAALSARSRWRRSMRTSKSAFFRNMLPLVEGELKKEHACTQCGAPVVPPDFFVASSANCDSCSSLNQFLPSRLLCGYGGAPRAFAEAAVSDLDTEIEALELDLNLLETDPRTGASTLVSRMEALQEVVRKRWVTYSEIFAQHAKKPVDATLVEREVAHWTQDCLERNQAWVSVHGRGG